MDRRRPVDLLTIITGLSDSQASHLFLCVNNVLEDALYLHWSLTGIPPLEYERMFRRELLLSPRFSLTVRTEQQSNHPQAKPTQDSKEWEDQSWSTVETATREERKAGNLQPNEQEKCIICLTDFSPADEGEIVKLRKCKGHFFHKSCISRAFSSEESVKCPVCGQIYGDLTGSMPDGTLQISLDPRVHCDGYLHCGTWVLLYTFPGGNSKGIVYTGTQRRAFLPNTMIGREVLRLLICAFYRRQSFIVGTSVTTGTANTVVWAVHHKTNLTGGATRYGYPDPTYFERVKEELKARGVVYAA
jgi:deltex-like protein